MKRSALNKILLWSLVLLVMAVIYGLSAQTSAESKALSGKTIRVIAVFLVPGFHDLSEGQQAQLVREWQSLVRKAAHLIIYMVLGAISCLALLQHEIDRRWQAAGALGICIAFAVSDEIHQFFVSGRGPQITDVFVDAAGALIGISLVFMALKLLQAKAKRGTRLPSSQQP